MNTCLDAKQIKTRKIFWIKSHVERNKTGREKKEGKKLKCKSVFSGCPWTNKTNSKAVQRKVCVSDANEYFICVQ